MLGSDVIFADLASTLDVGVDVVGDWLVVLKDDSLADLAIKLPPVDFVEVDLLVYR